MAPWFRKQAKAEPLVDFFSKELVRVWLMLDSSDDLSLNECGTDDIGTPPEWYRYERENMGWGDILDIGYQGEQDERALNWAIREGLAPDQPFLVELPHPVYSKSWTECGYEYDTSYEPEIIKKAKWSPKRAAKAWEKEMEGIMKARAFKRERAEKLRHLQRSDVASMRLCFTIYFGGHQSLYDDMTVPSGIRYTLESTANLEGKKLNWPTATLASGEDDRGDSQVAMKRLVEAAMKELPGLSEARIRSMPLVRRF